MARTGTAWHGVAWKGSATHRDASPDSFTWAWIELARCGMARIGAERQNHRGATPRQFTWAWIGLARCGMAWSGQAWRGAERQNHRGAIPRQFHWQGVDRTGKARHGAEWKGYIIGVQLPNSLQGQGEARLDLAWRGEARRGQATSSGCNSPTVFRGSARSGKARNGPARRGEANPNHRPFGGDSFQRHGKARRRQAGQGWARRGYIIGSKAPTVYLN